MSNEYDWQVGDLARQDIYPDERGYQPPVNPVDLPPEAYASLGGGDLGLLGSKGIAGLFGGKSWLQQAQDVTQKDVANYQSGGIPAVMGALAENSQPEQDLSGGFGGNIKGVKAPAVPGALAALGEYHPPFYSAVERAVQDAKQNVAPGQQWAGYLRNQPGVKPEEVETLGLGKLFEQPTVSKDALLGEIAANKVNVGEVMKGDLLAHDIGAQMVEPVGEHGLQYLRTPQDIADATRHNAQFRESTKGMSDADILAAAERLREAQKYTPTKFSSYTLPGGENYREMLLTLPTKEPFSKEHMAFNDEMVKKYGTEDYWNRMSNEDREAWANLPMAPKATPTFKSSHFDEPNILAHVRTNDRVIDGKKTLFVEEVQSDWHQKGKREGYQSGSTLTPDESGELRALQQRYDAQRGVVGDAFSTNDFYRMMGLQGKSSPQGVPDAPFKTTWPELAMKRIIREAAEKGYDKVAWTPGSVQAERYDLSKQVSQVQYDPERKLLKVRDLHDNKVLEKTVEPHQIEEYIGKEPAKKLLDAPMNGLYREIAGEGLKVGGEGMKGFYDEILPATVNKLVKKHGGRVQQEDMTAATAASPERVHTLDITPSLRAAAMKGFPLFTAGGVAATGAMGDLAKQDDYQ